MKNLSSGSKLVLRFELGAHYKILFNNVIWSTWEIYNNQNHDYHTVTIVARGVNSALGWTDLE